MTVTQPKTQLPDDDYIWKALNSANLNALRLALYHQTNDPELAAIKVNHVPVQGGALIAHALPRNTHKMIRQKAFDFIKSGSPSKPHPTKEQAIPLMEMFTGYKPSQGEIDFGYGDLAFDEFPRESKWTDGRPDDALKDFSVTIVGAGFSGMSAAIYLDRIGIKYRIIERLGDIGGTWELNDYPEARVDISNFLYQYKFVKNYPWKSYFAPRDELKDYINFVADKFNLRDKITLNTLVEKAEWHESKKKWVIQTKSKDGTLETLESNVVLSASGLFSTPNLPDIAGIESYKGKMFHTTAWDHSYDYEGKRIALIGTGSTGSQLMPRLAQSASKLVVFQRTPNWVMPLKGYHNTVSEEKHWLLNNFPGYWNWFIYSGYIGSVQVQDLQNVDPEWEAKGGMVNEKNALLAKRLTDFIRSEVGERDDLFEKLVPKYAPLGRRLVMDNGFYKALTQDNVELETSGIKKIVEDGIITNDGVKHEFDLIVLCAGFKVSRYLSPVNYVGRDGMTLDKAWEKDGARAYLSVTMPHYPNFFMFYGPTSQVRGGSFHSWQEATTKYICDLIINMVESGHSQLEVKRDVCEDYNSRMDAKYPELLWTPRDGGKGYFFNEHGRVITNMPWTTDEFYAMLRDVNPDDFIMS